MQALTKWTLGLSVTYFIALPTAQGISHKSIESSDRPIDPENTTTSAEPNPGSSGSISELPVAPAVRDESFLGILKSRLKSRSNKQPETRMTAIARSQSSEKSELQKLKEALIDIANEEGESKVDLKKLTPEERQLLQTKIKEIIDELETNERTALAELDNPMPSEPNSDPNVKLSHFTIIRKLAQSLREWQQKIEQTVRDAASAVAAEIAIGASAAAAGMGGILDGWIGSTLASWWQGGGSPQPDNSEDRSISGLASDSNIPRPSNHDGQPADGGSDSGTYSPSQAYHPEDSNPDELPERDSISTSNSYTPPELGNSPSSIRPPQHNPVTQETIPSPSDSSEIGPARYSNEGPNNQDGTNNNPGVDGTPSTTTSPGIQTPSTTGSEIESDSATPPNAATAGAGSSPGHDESSGGTAAPYANANSNVTQQPSDNSSTVAPSTVTSAHPTDGLTDRRARVAEEEIVPHIGAQTPKDEEVSLEQTSGKDPAPYASGESRDWQELITQAQAAAQSEQANPKSAIEANVAGVANGQLTVPPTRSLEEGPERAPSSVEPSSVDSSQMGQNAFLNRFVYNPIKALIANVTTALSGIGTGAEAQSPEGEMRAPGLALGEPTRQPAESATSSSQGGTTTSLFPEFKTGAAQEALKEISATTAATNEGPLFEPDDKSSTLSELTGSASDDSSSTDPKQKKGHKPNKATTAKNVEDVEKKMLQKIFEESFKKQTQTILPLFQISTNP